MRTLRPAAIVGAAACVVLLASGIALGSETTTTVASRVSGAQALIRHVERVEVGADSATVFMDVEGDEHAVEVDVSGMLGDVQQSLADDKTDLVDLVAIPVVGGAVLRLTGLLLRLGRQ